MTPPISGVAPTPAPDITTFGGFCQHFSADDLQVVGNDANGTGESLYLAVSVAIGRQAIVPLGWGPNPDSRTISVTLHGRQTVEQAMELANP